MDRTPSTPRPRHFRAGLLLGVVFVAGAALGPVAGQLGAHFGLSFGLAPAAFADVTGNSDTYRLLTLYGDVFERVRADYVDAVPDKDLVENSINGMLTGLDPHSNYMDAKAFRDMQVQTKGEFGGLGIEVTQDNGWIKVISPIDDTPASRAGVKSGDLITGIDGKTVQGLALSDAVDKMRGPPNSKITVTIHRDGVDKPIDISMLREVIKIQVIKDRMEPDNVGYVRLTQFTEQADAGLRKAVQQLKAEAAKNGAAGGKLKALILDLRNNPGGLLDQAVAVSSDFINEGEIVSTRARHAEDSQRWNAKGGDIIEGIPLVVLTNNGSASSSEIVAGALQDHRRAVLLGTKTFGKGSVQTVIPLPGNGAMRLTTARYYTPSGRSIQGLGITPDVTVHESRDEQARFGPEHEADLNHTLSNTGGTPQQAEPPRTDLPAIAKEIPDKPPEGFPKFDPAKPDPTDYQLQQALVLAKAMAAQTRAAN
jgi:carboxyl-terminal processing protease